MNKKIGPLPMWAWAVIAGVGGLLLYRYYQNANAGSSSGSGINTTGILDPNAVDPNTGITYGEEEAAALNGQAANAATGGGSLGGGTSESGAQGTVPATNEFGDFLTFLGDWQQMAQSLGWQPPVSNSGTASGSGAAAVTTPSNAPTSSPSSHINPNLITGGAGLAGAAKSTGTAVAHTIAALSTSAGIAGDSARSFLAGITAGHNPYNKVKGSTQKGGLAQTGTYVRPGSNTVYYAWSQGGTLHVRQASKTPKKAGKK